MFLTPSRAFFRRPLFWIGIPLAAVLAPLSAHSIAAQAVAEGVSALPPAAEAGAPEPVLHTFSIVAVEPSTGELGVAVTTRVPCVGNIVPWLRAGTGAVATQARVRIEYGEEILDLLEDGLVLEEALRRALAADEGAAERQIGVVTSDGDVAQHTGQETIPWAGHRPGEGFAVQGNLLVGAEVVDAVAESFETTAGTPRHLADRLVEALEAGQAAGGDARKGLLQSAAVVVADPREGVARRPDGVTVDIHVCEHPEAVAEVRRVYDTISGTLGWRTLQQFSGRDVVQLKTILHALGYFRPDAPGIAELDDRAVFDEEAAEAVEAFRADQGLSTSEIWSPRGLVDRETVEGLWRELEERDLAEDVRRELLELTAVRH